MFKRLALLLTLCVLAPSAANAACKVWQPGEVIKATDLNACHSYINSTVVGQRGARLVDADVSPTANIALSKLAAQILLPKAWAVLRSGCDGAAAAGTTCTVAGGTGITSIKSTGSTGVYGVTLTQAPSSLNFAPIATSGDAAHHCSSGLWSLTAPHFKITCSDGAGAASNATFSLIVMGP